MSHEASTSADSAANRAAAQNGMDLVSCKRLYQAIITQQLGDAGSHSAKEDNQIARSAARAFLLYDSELEALCDFADLDAREVREAARSIVKRGWIFRRPRQLKLRYETGIQLTFPFRLKESLRGALARPRFRRTKPEGDWQQLPLPFDMEDACGARMT